VFVVDTNILLQTANRDCREHDVCLQLIERSRNQSGAWKASRDGLFEEDPDMPATQASGAKASLAL
jgi:hypothetical protein